ncbi:hypothetical protein GCM10007301_24460 [Azorhizobium oxalatiphilum]|uniref:Methyltransferase type 11 domain-containing protein n=1 Tax=Azorhizobium oxalatiphilum TaxID=980631 RepID=A0A917FC31_9HYPH|nr:hypothetical protein [Azorhizobium oxalatiphilum]GGF63775.1 hypothetical protein GCM10007301_24460 [Azorhizobium oxalatiphilum]
MKKLLKTTWRKLLKFPVVGYLLRLTTGIFRLPRIDAKLTQARAQITALEAQIEARGDSERARAAQARNEEAWSTHIPAFLNAVSSVGAFGHDLQRQGTALADLSRRIEAVEGQGAAVTDLQQIAARHWSSIGEVWQRLEFMRKEILFEVSLGNGPATQALEEPKVLDPKRVEALTAKGLRVNMGCGHVPFDDYVNVDARELPGVDVQARLDKMPFVPGSVAEIFSAHVLEHFSHEDLRRRLLPYWFSLLEKGGAFRAIVPDSLAMTKAMADGEVSFEDYREVTYGGQEYQGDFHFNMFSPDSLRQTLEEAGFADVQLIAEGRRNGKCFELEMSARKA